VPPYGILLSLIFVVKTIRPGNKSETGLLVLCITSCRSQKTINSSKNVQSEEYDWRRCDVTESSDAFIDVRAARWCGEIPCTALWASDVTMPTGARRVGPRTDTRDDRPRRRWLRLCI